VKLRTSALKLPTTYGGFRIPEAPLPNTDLLSSRTKYFVAFVDNFIISVGNFKTVADNFNLYWLALGKKGRINSA
jgi:hypothetical protein